MIKILFALLVSISILASIPAALAVTPPAAELQRQIEEKSTKLREINQQLQETQKNLAENEEKGRSLNQEVKRINSNIKQLDLGIKSSQTTIEKLELEIAQLELDIDETKEKIGLKKRAVQQLLHEIQVQDAEDPLVTFLKNRTLTDGLTATQQLGEVRNKLVVDMGVLKELQKEFNDQLDNASQKKQGKEGEQQTLKVRKGLVEDEKKEKQSLIKITKNQQKVYEQLFDDLAKKQAEIAEEVEALEADLRKQIDPTALPGFRPGVLGWPVNGSHLLTQEYGATSFASRGGYRGRWHNGIDIRAPKGTPILSAEDGFVINTGDQDKFCRRGAYGKYLVVRHPNNLATLYAHLSQITVSDGQSVKRGQVVGYSGNTGYSRGSHLHFTVWSGNTYQLRGSRTCGPMPSGGDIDPRKYL